MATKLEILDAALLVLRQGEPLTIDAVARQAGLTKPGVVHHFATKEVLTVAVVDRLVDLWTAQLTERVPENASPQDRLRAYVDFSLTADLDPADLAVLSDVRLRDRLREQWTGRLAPWFGQAIATDARGRAVLQAARLLADGAWFDRALGIVELDERERAAILAVGLRLIDEGSRA
ncbi:TetR family transcriptional regulator [Promicromonospora sp. NPDC023987]|uniref:TetR/AcrR family transcriptional regulator n=1 Tax=Promicromonospora sp. NPDC023987 TaxID=3155360 RepID=UPI0033FE0D5F